MTAKTAQESGVIEGPNGYQSVFEASYEDVVIKVNCSYQSFGGLKIDFFLVSVQSGLCHFKLLFLFLFFVQL